MLQGVHRSGAYAAARTGACRRPASPQGWVGDVLAQVVALGRSVAAERRTPFEGVELTLSQLSLLVLLAHSPCPTPVTAGPASCG